MKWWTALGSWVTFALALSALIFSLLCYRMIRLILHHVLQFNPSYQQQIKEIHEEVTNDEEA